MKKTSIVFSIPTSNSSGKITSGEKRYKLSFHHPIIFIDPIKMDGAEEMQPNRHKLYTFLFLFSSSFSPSILQEWPWLENKYIKNMQKTKTISPKELNYLLSLLSRFFDFTHSPNNENRPPFCGRTGVPLTCLPKNKLFEFALGRTSLPL